MALSEGPVSADLCAEPKSDSPSCAHQEVEDQMMEEHSEKETVAIRRPLKRLCDFDDNTNKTDSTTKRISVGVPKRRKFSSSIEDENLPPSVSGSAKSLLRLIEQEVKPDTPVIPSVRARVQKLTEQKRDKRDGETYSPQDASDSQKPIAGRMDSWEDETSHSTTTGSEHGSSLRSLEGLRSDLDASASSRESVDIGSSFSSEGSSLSTSRTKSVRGGPAFRSVLEKFEMRPEKQQDLTPLSGGGKTRSVTQTTRAIQEQLLHQHECSPSFFNATRIRREREQELAMLKGQRDGNNPWKEGEKAGNKLNVKQATSPHDFEELDVGDDTRDHADSTLSLDQSGERAVSFLEVKLRPQSAGSSESLSIPERKDTDNENEDRKDSVDAKMKQDDVDLKEDEMDLLLVLSPLSNSVNLEAVVTPLSLDSGGLSASKELFQQGDNDCSQQPDGSVAEESALLYSVDAYRSQRRSTRPRKQTEMRTKNVDAERVVKKNLMNQTLNVQEKVKELNDEINSLQAIVHQTSQALNCCVDEEHGKGSLEEAEAERLLLISSEKRLALLTELNRLKGEGASQVVTCVSEGIEPCGGTVTLSHLQLPLKVEFVCSAMQKPGKPSQYFLVMIRYGSGSIVATPLATAEDAQNGDSITFPTTVTLKEIRSDFEIDVEVYSLAQTAPAATIDKRRSKRTNTSTPVSSSQIVNSVRTSNFTLVGSHKITLASLGKNKFPLDKVKFEGKVRQLLGDQFQEKVPFLSPLEGNIYLKLRCWPHSAVEHRGFLTMFEDVSGLGAWHRCWCALSGNCISYWSDPNDERRKMPLGCINLTNCTNGKIEPISREVCVRPRTFELITVRPQREDDRETLVSQCRNTLCFTKLWLSADTKQEQTQWIQKLNQVLVDLRTWRSFPGETLTASQPLSDTYSLDGNQSQESSC
nr:PREDICTED: actin-binding protein anillin-like [Latimeria chalumnae]|eukprot:XP_005988024.1 PREDICTED: actin-binding protein anillin-like [Latimeria chalumnae]